MPNEYIFPITKNFNYFDVENFRTKKLEGTVELKEAELPGVDAYVVSPRLYVAFKRDGNLPEKAKREIAHMTKKLIDKYKKITVRTCFRFSGYENPRSLPAFRDLTSVRRVEQAFKDAYTVGEEFAKENGIDWFELGLIILGRVDAEKSGIILVDVEKSNLCVVETCWGDVHLIAAGEDYFDSFWVDPNGTVVRKQIRAKKHGYYFDDGVMSKKKIPLTRQAKVTLNEKEVKILAESAFKAAQYHKTSVEIEYMVRKDGLIDMYELQERPGFTLQLPKEEDDSDGSLASGVSVYGGSVEGVVRIVQDLEELKKVAPGEILVLPSKMMGEDIPVIGKIGALVTDTGGMTAHISTIAKECKVPCIVGTGDASKKLKDGMKIIVDATNGKIYPQIVQSLADMDKEAQVMWLQGLKAKIDTIGAKAANLVALMQMGVKVPDAYAISTKAFDTFLEQNSIKNDIQGELANIDLEDLGDTEEKIRTRIEKGTFEKKLEKNVLHAFKYLTKDYGKVSVRSSATCEDSRKASFAGQFQSFLFVDDTDTLFESIKRCWSSLYRAGAILYATQHGINVTKTKMAVIIQGMIDAEIAGVMFTKNFQGDDDSILIEAAEGVGENVVSGEVTPVTYTVDRTGTVLNKNGSDEDLLDSQIIRELVKLGVNIEETFGIAQDIEWAVKDSQIYILQSRPITV